MYHLLGKKTDFLLLSHCSNIEAILFETSTLSKYVWCYGSKTDRLSVPLTIKTNNTSYINLDFNLMTTYVGQQKDRVGGSRKWPVFLTFSTVFMLIWTLSAKDRGATESPVKWFGTKFEQNCTLEVFCCLSAFSCCWLE